MDKTCPKCGVTKPLDGGFGRIRVGGHQGWCKACRSRSTSDRYHSLPPVRAWAVWSASRLVIRSRERGMPCDISPDYLESIAVPVCPVLSLPLRYARGDQHVQPDSPSVDRFDPLGGYTVGNVAVISQRANQIKTNAGAEEVHAVWKWMTRETAARIAP